MNLPNALTVGRIIVTPLVAALPFVATPAARLSAFLLFLVAAISDYADGVLARSRKQETTLGKLLDPLADKLLLVGTFVPMWMLMQPARDTAAATSGAVTAHLALNAMPFLTPWGDVGLPWWIVVIVLGRELLMTVFRQFAARRGVVIAAIGPAKWKTAFQLIWQGAAYFWFFAATLSLRLGWNGPLWRGIAFIVGIIGAATMSVAVVLTVYSLWLYLARYGRLFVASSARG